MKEQDNTDELIIREETSGYSFEKSKGDREDNINNSDVREAKRILDEWSSSFRLEVGENDDSYYINIILEYIKQLEEENAMLKKVNNITENITTEDIENAIKEANKEYEKQQAELKKKDRQIKQLSEQSRTFDKQAQNYFEQGLEMSLELEKKDKIINEMALNIAANDSNLCQYIDETIRCKKYAGENKLICDECIKQYFERKVENEN